MKILWTNPNSSPAAAFESQTVTLSESIANYQMLMVVVFIVGGEFFGASMASGTLVYVDAGGAGDRPYTLSGSTVAFGTGRYNSVNNNVAAVPCQIYGINGIC